MAPTQPGTLVVDTLSPDTLPEKFERRKPRRIGPLTQKGLPRKKPGPAPKPLSERLKARALKEVKRVERSYTRERRIQVLLWLINHRVPDARTTHLPRRRMGQPLVLERSETDANVWYRPPTYEEASQFWKVPIPTIQGWWDRRKKILEGTGIEVPEVPEVPGDVTGIWGHGESRGDGQGEEGQGNGQGEDQGVPQLNGAEQQTGSIGPQEAENRATPAAPSGSEPSPNENQALDTPAPIQTPTPATKGTSPPNVSGTETLPASQQQPAAMNGAQPLTTQARVIKFVSPRPAPRKPPPVRSNPPDPFAAVARPPVQPAQPVQTVQPGPQISPLPPAFNPANYVVVYIGPPGSGPLPGQHCIHPGAILPVVYCGQPLEVPPLSYAAVWPSHPPPVHSGPAVYPGPHHLSHGPQGLQGPQGPPGSCLPSGPPGISHGPSQQGQPGVPPGQHPPPNPAQAATPRGARPLAPRPDQPPPLQWKPPLGPPPGSQARPAPAPWHTSSVGPPGYFSPYAPPQSFAAAQMPHPHARPHPLSAPVHTGPAPTPRAQAPQAPATSGPLPTQPVNAAPPQGQHPVAPPPRQHPTPTKSPPTPPSPNQQASATVRAEAQGPPTNAAEPATAGAVDTAKSQQKEGERTDTNTPERRGSPPSAAINESQSRDADVDASTAVSSVSSPIAAASMSQNENASTPLATAFPPNEDTAVTSPAATATLQEAHLPMEVDGDAEEPAERISAEDTPTEKAAPMEVDTETPTEAGSETPMEVDTEMVSEARAAIAVATKGSPDSLFGSVASTPAP